MGGCAAGRVRGCARVRAGVCVRRCVVPFVARVSKLFAPNAKNGTIRAGATKVSAGATHHTRGRDVVGGRAGRGVA